MAGYRRKATVVSSSGEECIIVGQEGLKVPSEIMKLTVGEVEKLTGVSKETLRFYGQKELLRPERTGEGVANNRKLYGIDDLERLQTIQTLRAYDFSLDEIKQILDDGLDVYDVMSEKLLKLKLQEARMRMLILFARFIDLIDDDLLEGLANGPARIESLSDLARENAQHEEVLQKLDAYSEEEAAEKLKPVCDIIAELIIFDEARGFAGIEDQITKLAVWWDDFAVPINDVGYLGFWAVFEDHSLIPEYIESMFQAGSAGFVQMFSFFVLIEKFASAHDDLIAQIALLADNDIVAAIEKSQELIAAAVRVLLGKKSVDSMPSSEKADLACIMLAFTACILGDDELNVFLGLADKLAFDGDDIDKVMRVLAIMGSEE